jgi:hypothetical protein
MGSDEYTILKVLQALAIVVSICYAIVGFIWLFVIPFVIFKISANIQRMADVVCSGTRTLPHTASVLRQAARDPLRNQALDSLKG